MTKNIYTNKQIVMLLNEKDKEIAQLRAELEEAKDTISRIQKKARLDIPVYAYADNQAAVDMAVSLAEIADIVAAFLAAHPEEPK